MITPDEIENQKSDEQKRLDSHWEEIQMESQVWEEYERRRLCDEDLDQLEAQARKAEAYFELKAIERQEKTFKLESCLKSIEGMKKAFKKLGDLKNEPYEVVEKIHRTSASTYKITKILERRTRKVIGFKSELKYYG